MFERVRAAVTAAMWIDIAYVWAFAVAMGNVTDTVWDVTASMWAAHALCGLFQPVRGLLQVLHVLFPPLCGLRRFYEGCYRRYGGLF